MKIVLKYFCFILIGSVTGNSYAQNMFNNQYDFLKGPEVFNKLAYNNNEFYLGGATWDSTLYLGVPTNKSKIGIIKTDNNGIVQWEKRYGNDLYIYQIGGYGDEMAMVGNNFYFIGQYYDTYSKFKHCLFKFNNQGDSLLLKHYYEADTTIESYSSVCKATIDGKIVVSGIIDSSFYGKASQMMLSKQDTNGNVIWQKGYGGSNWEDCISMDLCADNGYILGGWTRSYGGVDRDSYVVKVDSLGVFEWQKVYNTNENDAGALVLSTSDGGYLIGTTETQFIAGSASYMKIYFTKLDALGNQLWRKSYGGILRETVLSSLIEVNGNYVGVYYKWFENEIIKLNANGDSLFFEGIHHYSTPCLEQTEYAHTIIPTTTGFAVSGFIVPFPAYVGQSQVDISQDAWLVTLDTNACQLPNRPYNLNTTVNYVGSDTLINITWQYNSTSPNEKFIVERLDSNIYDWHYWINVVNNCYSTGTNGHSFVSSLNFTDTLTNRTKATYRVLAIDTTNELMSCHSEIIEIDLTTTIKEEISKNHIVVYPNPASSNITIEGINSPYNLKIYNSIGQLLYLEQNVLASSKKIAIEKYKDGLLFIQINAKGETYHYKIVKR